MQMVGTLVGAVLNYVITITITTNQREILLSIEGTHIWSGAVSLLPSHPPVHAYISGFAILQHPSCYMGRPSQANVLLRLNLPMGATRSRAGFRRSAPHLRSAPLLPQSRLQLPQRVHQLLAHRVAGHRHKRRHHKLHRRRILEPVLSEKI